MYQLRLFLFQKEVKRNIKEYNLDVIIAIGYQVNLVLGTKFRIWATKSFDNFKIEQIVRNYLNISSLRVIFGVAQPELSQENLEFFGVTSKICAICFCDAKMVSELTSAFNSIAPFFAW
jgi:hypothetical protein